MAFHAFFPRPSGARLPLQGNQKKFSTPPSENPAPPDFRLPGRRCVASATAAQRPPAIFIHAGNSTNPFDVLFCTRLISAGSSTSFFTLLERQTRPRFLSGTAKARTKTAYYNVVGRHFYRATPIRRLPKKYPLRSKVCHLS